MKGYLRNTQQLKLIIGVLIPHSIGQAAVANPLALQLSLPADKEWEGHAGLEVAGVAISHAAYAGVQEEAGNFRHLHTSVMLRHGWGNSQITQRVKEFNNVLIKPYNYQNKCTNARCTPRP